MKNVPILPINLLSDYVDSNIIIVEAAFSWYQNHV